MRGGVNIGSGTDGCVFNSRFDKDGNVIPDSKNGAAGIATKVYSVGAKPGSMNSAAVNEYNMMMKVRKVTNGLGVAVALDNSLRQLAKIDEEEVKTIPTPVEGACEHLTNPKKSPYTVIELPLVSGSLSRFGIQWGSFPDSAFTTLKSALDAMAAAKLTQLDLAARNIFYLMREDGELTFLLGDFGNGIDLGASSEQRFKDFTRLVVRYDSYPHTVIYRDGFHYRAYLYMIAAVFLGLAVKKEDKAAGKYLWTSVQGRFKQWLENIDKFKNHANWRILRFIESAAPDPMKSVTNDELEKAFQELKDLPEDAAPPAAPGESAGQAASTEPAVPGGEVPFDAEIDQWAQMLEASTKDFETYKGERDTFVNGYINGIKQTCQELMNIPFESDHEKLMETATAEILKSDMYQYELLYALYAKGPIAERLKRLNTAWGFSAEAKQGAYRRRTYRRKRVKMSRRR